MNTKDIDSRYFEIRSLEEKKRLVLEGKPVVFGQKALIHDTQGDFYEVIEAGAFDKCSLRGVHLFYNHDTSRVPLARSPKTMELTVTPEGLHMRAVLPNTESARSVYSAVKRGDLSGMSFAFIVATGGDSYDAESNTRTIREISKLLECSIVPYPAYPQASIEARSAMENGRKRYNAVRKAKILIHQIQTGRVFNDNRRIF